MRWITLALVIALALSACATTNRVDDLEQRIAQVETNGTAADGAIVWCADADNENRLLFAVIALEPAGIQDLMEYSNELEADGVTIGLITKKLIERIRGVWRDENPDSYNRVCQAAFDSR